MTRMFVPAIHSGTITSILGMTLKISRRTVKLLKCWGFFEVCEFFLCPVDTFCFLLWTFSLAIRGGSRRRDKHDMIEICIIKVHLRGVSKRCLQNMYPTGPSRLNWQCYLLYIRLWVETMWILAHAGSFFFVFFYHVSMWKFLDALFDHKCFETFEVTLGYKHKQW